MPFSIYGWYVKIVLLISVGFSGAFYGGFGFCEGPDKIGYDTLDG